MMPPIPDVRGGKVRDLLHVPPCVPAKSDRKDYLLSMGLSSGVTAPLSLFDSEATAWMRAACKLP
eukprot:7814935-Pyramimonas_sp.AAC.1